eukprot:881287-Rhodomonas_salina.1
MSCITGVWIKWAPIMMNGSVGSQFLKSRNPAIFDGNAIPPMIKPCENPNAQMKSMAYTRKVRSAKLSSGFTRETLETAANATAATATQMYAEPDSSGLEMA